MNDKLVRHLDGVKNLDEIRSIGLNRKLLWGVLAALLVIVIFVVMGWAMYFVQKGELENARSQIQQYQTEAAGLKQKIKELEKEVASRGPRVNINGIKSRIDQGVVWHAVDFFNESGSDLHEVRVSINLVGENGDQKSEARYFGLWSAGERLHVDLKSENSPKNVQKYSLTGWCDEGNIAVSWTP